MGFRKVGAGLVVSATLLADQTLALGLGEAVLKSSLNEPLLAEISLFQVKSLEPENILVRLASKEDFRRVGVEPNNFLKSLSFDVVTLPSGKMVVRVTSDKPISEPYLNFLVESRWPSGRILREYTLLLDLPIVSDQQSAQINLPASQSTTTVTPDPAMSYTGVDIPPEARRSSSTGLPSATPTVGDPLGEEETYGPVEENETLWVIAANARQGADLTVPQVMMTIQKMNPDAFIEGNINRLKKGSTLRLPTPEQVEELSVQDANQQVAQQNNLWQQGKETFGARLDASGQVASAPPEPEIGLGRVRLGVQSLNSADDASSGRGAAASSRSSALKNELSLLMEQLDGTRRENSELTERVSELEAQISTMERLIEVSNVEMRALQLAGNPIGDPVNSSEQTQKTLGMEVQGAVTAQTVANRSAPSNSAPSNDVAAPQNTQLAQGHAAPTTGVEEAAHVGVGNAPSSGSLIDNVLGNLFWIVSGFIALLAGIGFVLFRRKPESEYLEPIAVGANDDVKAEHQEPLIETEAFDSFSSTPDVFPEAVANQEVDKSIEDESEVFSGIPQTDQFEVPIKDNSVIDLQVSEPQPQDGPFDPVDSDLDESADAAADEWLKNPQESDWLPASEEGGGEIASVQWQPSNSMTQDTTLDQGVSFKPKNPDALVDEADIYFNYEKYQEAEEKLREAILINPSHVPTLTGLLRVYAKLPKLEEFDKTLDNLKAVGDSETIAEAVALRETIPGASDYKLTPLQPDDPMPMIDGFLDDDLDLDSITLDKNQVDSILSEPLDLTTSDRFSTDKGLSESGLSESGLGESGLSEEAALSESSVNSGGQTGASANKSPAKASEPSPLAEDSLDDLLSLSLSSGDSFATTGSTASEKSALSDDSLTLVDEKLSQGLDLDSLDKELDALVQTEAIFDPSQVTQDTSEGEKTVDPLTSEATEKDLRLSDASLPLASDPLLIAHKQGSEEKSEDDMLLLLDFDEESNTLSSEKKAQEEATATGTPNHVPAQGVSLQQADASLAELVRDEKDLDAEFSFLEEVDEVATKLDLARAYIEMGDSDGAKGILGEVAQEGNDAQKDQAKQLMAKMAG